MREIKMKVWVDNERMIGPFDLSQNPTYWAHKLEDGERLLYTGLKDKNGVEIYEGDILSAFYGTQLTEVKWNSEYGLYEVALQLSGGSETVDELLGNHLGVVEVIGNIYENPELLEGAE